MNKHSHPAFSLLELMIVIAIIGFLSMVSVPSFMRFLAKAKRAEVYLNLSSIYLAQKAYWAEHGTYSDVLFGSNGIGWRPDGYTGGGAQEAFYYTYGFGHGAEGVNFVTGKLQANSSELSVAFAHKDAFLVVAAADIDGDGVADVWTVDQYNNIRLVQDDLN